MLQWFMIVGLNNIDQVVLICFDRTTVFERSAPVMGRLITILFSVFIKLHIYLLVCFTVPNCVCLVVRALA